MSWVLRKMATELNLDKIRQKLEEERLSIRQRLGDDEQPNGRSEILNLDRADLAQSYARQERDAILADQEEEQLAQIETALQKLDEGRYGLCDNCGQQIAPGRLEVLPYANLCIRCQSEQQKQ